MLYSLKKGEFGNARTGYSHFLFWFKIYSLSSLSSVLDVYYQQKLPASIMSHKVPCCKSGANILFNKNTF